MNDGAFLDAVISPIVALTFSAGAVIGARTFLSSPLLLGIAAVAGFLLGWLTSRKMHS